jgi:hypothetical protein
VPGNLTVTGPVSVSLSVPGDGAYSVSLPAGTYVIEGRSSMFGGGTCFPYSEVSVVAGSTSLNDVFCAMK